MISPAHPSLLAALCAAGLAAAMIARQRFTLAAWCFLFGMLFLGAESFAHARALAAASSGSASRWEMLAFLAAAAHSFSWLTFSLVFSRGNHLRFLSRWRWILGSFALFPVILVLLPGGGLGGVLVPETDAETWYVRLLGAGKVLNIVLLVQAVLILTNLETTFRSAVGTMQWKIKFVVLAFGVIFGARIYTRSQALLFSGYDATLPQVEAFAVVLGCGLILLAYARSGLAEIDVYPSQAILNSSVTVFLAGAYLFVVGVLAQLVARVGGMASLQLQGLVVLFAVALLGVLLLSDRLRQGVRLFVSRHFHRPRYDSREVWKLVTQRTSRLLDRHALCQEVAKVISETFQALSVTVWTIDASAGMLRHAGSTANPPGPETGQPLASESMRASLVAKGGPFDLERESGAWAEQLRAVSAPQFPEGGNRLCVPLLTGDRWLGVIVLADRVNGVPYGSEELDLLRCIGDQVSATVLNLELTGELMLARELEAFQTMSTFLVHDMKNTASTLSLMLKNLPVHFDNPEFRQDAIRGIANTVDRVNDLIHRLGAVREKLEPRPTQWDFNEMIMEAIGDLRGETAVEIRQSFQPLPPVIADREQIRSVATNLLFNSRDALGAGGRITVQTELLQDSVVLAVSDNGCGMSREFVQSALFRPFQTTKKKGLGIGMFQSRMIVEAHRGRIQVQSEPGVGTTFRVSLPLHASTTSRGGVSQ